MDPLSLMHLQLGTWPTTQAYALTRNYSGDLLVHKPELNPLNHSRQGSTALSKNVLG